MVDGVRKNVESSRTAFKALQYKTHDIRGGIVSGLTGAMANVTLTAGMLADPQAAVGITSTNTFHVVAGAFMCVVQ